MKESRLTLLAIGFCLYSFAGLATYFLSDFALSYFVERETQKAVSMILSIAAMFNTIKVIEWGDP